ncbi:MAG TPA: gamma-glutamyl-gamma-aminobutyrate hydrolase family protein [Candidatus Methylomirabilis sp.]|nr:gamma-glutamyl-gamma-aminobutyrate hydrolase family protein [Candidatus Methylomirabilis sp.]
MRPRIGITSWHRNDGDKLERWEAIRDTYTGAVTKAGGLPIILPIADDAPDLIGDFLDTLDGLLFTGGEDVAPAYYGEAIDERCQEPDGERDLFEIHLARAALERRTPALGICRGLQLLNVAAGGTLYQDIACRPGTLPHHAASAPDRQKLIHAVRILPRTRLHAIMGVTGSRVTSTHHQFVKDLAPGFRVTAESLEDGIVEAFEHPGYPFLLAVQWHPERMVHDHAEHLALFRGLVEAAGRARKA